jgi:hypothetical protein
VYGVLVVAYRFRELEPDASTVNVSFTDFSVRLFVFAVTAMPLLALSFSSIEPGYFVELADAAAV